MAFSRRKRLRSKDPVHARSADPQPPCNLCGTNTVFVKLPHLWRFGAGGRCSTLVLSFGLRLGNTFSLAFEHEVTLKLSNSPKHVEHKPAS
jgi:hypothetical protein